MAPSLRDAPLSRSPDEVPHAPNSLHQSPVRGTGDGAAGRPIAQNRKNALFAGHDAGAGNWGIIASLIETCKMNGVDPHAWLSATLTAIVEGHEQSQIDDLLPWNYAVTV